ncbi:MAG: hypothetical protein Q9182_001115 [Xanthomendoza sp. 2 TL-2023]
MSPTIIEPSSLERHLSKTEESQLTEALQLRKRQIDREIAEFAVEKEKEFRKFEKRLRSEKRDAERLKILQCEREVDKANQKRRGSRDQLAICSPDEVNGTGNRVGEIESNGVNGVRFSGAVEIPPGTQANPLKKEKKKKNSANGGTSYDQQPSHEREVEFQGLFTPNYLPLLSGLQQDRQDDVPDTTSTRRDQITSSDKPVLSSAPALSDLRAPLSGNAPATSASSQHLSSSDPRKMSMAERRSSSRSDTSVSSRRSSIRDRKQPRSPKRVLFSIDNVVVSPSTSPTMQRKANASKKDGNSGRSVVIPSDPTMPEDIGHQNQRFSVQPRGSSGQASRTALTNIPSSKAHVNSGQLPFYPAAPMVNSSPSMGGDGFEHVRGGDDDDLFAFDEDVLYRDEPSGNDGGSDEIREDELDNDVEVLPTSSPHAGSLPIEINWPGRKEPRG